MPAQPAPVVAFLSDFGLADPWVGVCHTVIARLAPAVRVVDLCHAVRPFDVRQGAMMLADCAGYTGACVHLAVVDPGVGTERLQVAVAAGDDGALLVGPDNGLLLEAADRLGGVTGAWQLASVAHRLATVSPTFHGRDVFAPAAAHLATGVPPAALGPPLDPARLVRLPPDQPRRSRQGLEARVAAIDRFGNLALAARPAHLAGLPVPYALEVGAHRHPLRPATTFGDVAEGELLWFEDAFGWLAIGVRGGSAADRLGVTLDQMVRVRTVEERHP